MEKQFFPLLNLLFAYDVDVVAVVVIIIIVFSQTKQT